MLRRIALNAFSLSAISKSRLKYENSSRAGEGSNFEPRRFLNAKYKNFLYLITQLCSPT